VLREHEASDRCILPHTLSSLPTLDRAADKGFAFSMQRRLISKRRRIAEQDGRGGALHRILASPADNFAVSLASCPWRFATP
jgi:hypothetical protein